MDHYRAALDALTAAGWTVRERSSALPAASVWPPELIRRYPTIPDALTAFMARVDACVNADETAWFLTASDYAGTSDFAFAWNEWERMELESHQERGDSEHAAAVREFWNAYLPFFLDVSGDYAYFAIRVVEPRPVPRTRLPWGARREPDPPRGTVVHGIEEFRAVSQVAASFDEFLAKLAVTVGGREGDGPLAGLV